MKECIEFKLTPFEEFMNSVDDGCEPNELELFAEMTDSYMEMSEIIQEGKILDAATGKGENEKTWVKVIKFIPRLVKALVRALLNKINKNKIKIKELEKTLEELKKNNEKLKEDNAELKNDLKFKKDIVDSLIRSNSDLQTDLIAKGIDLDIANEQLKEYEDQNAFQAIHDAKLLKKLKIKCNYDLFDDVDTEVKKLLHDSKEFDELIEKFIIDVSHKNATTEDQVKKIFEHYFWSPVDQSKRTDVRDKQYDMKEDFSEDLYKFGISIVYMYNRYEEALNAIDSNNDLITKRLEELAKGREDSKTKFGYDPLSDEQLKIIKNLFTEYFKNANSIRKDIEWFFIVETPKYSPKLRELGKASDDYMK